MCTRMSSRLGCHRLGKVNKIIRTEEGRKLVQKLAKRKATKNKGDAMKGACSKSNSWRRRKNNSSIQIYCHAHCIPCRLAQLVQAQSIVT
mmetsp:Transcript_5019/g.12590  ORF Transcript_5019/g.12590 Transcript_5019/m.12590 type:complete len:90 (-) Transcript_5019:4-273(-)